MPGRLLHAPLTTPRRVRAGDAVAAVLAITLAACAIPPAPSSASSAIQPAPIQARTTAIGTLATWGTWETEWAPAATRAEVIARRTVADYRARRIDWQTVASVEGLLTRAREALVSARRGNAKDPTDEQRRQLAAARRLTDLAANLLESPQ